MFILLLKNKIVAYDRYGEHRTNGLKALFVLELMMLFYFFSSIQNPYFYFFYAPITCFAAEIAGRTLEEKYLFLFCTLVGTIISIFLFGVLSIYKLFFVFFVFFYALSLYFIVHFRLRSMLAIVPLILSLASYSLIYGEFADSNFYVALNHALETLAATAVIFAGLYIFPKSYYLAIWRRAFCEVVVNLESLSAKICRGEVKDIAIFSGIIVMERYSKMLSRRIKYYSILRITLLVYELVLTMSYLLSFQKQLRMEYVKVLHKYLVLLREGCVNKQMIVITPQERRQFNETHELKTLYQLILSWNYLCQHQ